MALRGLVCGFLLLVLGFGCGKGGPKPVTELPQGGVIVAIPKGKGFVEIIKKLDGIQNKDGVPVIKSELSFFFYKDKQNPYESPPDSGVFETDDGRQVTLQSDGDALVSPAGPVIIGDGEILGWIVFDLEGEEYKLRIGRR